MKLVCCNKDAVWMDQGPNLQYWFCTECRQEVLQPLALEEKKDIPGDGGGSDGSGFGDPMGEWPFTTYSINNMRVPLIKSIVLNPIEIGFYTTVQIYLSEQDELIHRKSLADRKGYWE